MRLRNLVSPSQRMTWACVLPGQRWRRMRDSNSRGVAPNTLSNNVGQRSPASCPPPYVSCADRDGWVSVDTREPRRMRPHLRPAGTGRHHRVLVDLPRPGDPSSRSHGVTGGSARPRHTQRRTPTWSGPVNSQFAGAQHRRTASSGRCRIRGRPVISTARPTGFGGSVPVHDRRGHLRARPSAPRRIRTLKRHLAHGWVADSSSLRAWVAWVRV
jgi:hypothetical protein